MSHISRATIILGAAVVALLIAVAGLVGYLIADQDNQPAAAPAPASSTTTAVAKPVTLRHTVQQMAADADRHPDSTRAWTAMKRYAEPACAAVIDSFINGFGGSDSADSHGKTTIVSVTETGNRGTSTTRTGNDTNDTLHWLRRDNVWRFTCEGIFTATATTSEPEPETPAVDVADTPTVGGSCPTVGATTGGLRCAPADSYASQRWAHHPLNCRTAPTAPAVSLSGKLRAVRHPPVLVPAAGTRVAVLCVVATKLRPWSV